MATKQTLVVGELTAVDNTQAAFQSVQRSVRNTAKSTAALNQQFRFLRGGAGQLGHQIQDIAVQLSMGTNAMIVFGQQGSQIASLFGPKGAIIGAFAAVAAAIGVVFLRDAKQAGKELETFGEKAVQAAKEMGILTEISRDFLTILQRDNVNKAANQLQTYKQRLSESNEELAQLERDLNAVSGGIATVEQSLRLQGVTQEDVNRKIIEQRRESKLLAGQVEILNREHQKEIEILRALQEQANPYEDLEKNAKEATARLEEQIANREAREKAEMDFRLSKLKYLQYLNDAEMRDLIEADKVKKELWDKEQERQKLDLELRQAKTDNIIANANRELEAIIAVEEQKRQAKEAQMALDKQVMSSGQQLLGQLMAGMDQQSGAYKALFAAQQAVAIAQTIINAEAAATAALAPVALGGLGPVAGAPYAKMIRAMGYASAGLIAAQTVASFEGGGFTGPGARSGGIDGRGGFPAILHPNETVVDHRNGGGATIVQHINISTGVAQTVRAEILNLMPQIAESAKAAVADSRMRGGGFSKALTGM